MRCQSYILPFLLKRAGVRRIKSTRLFPPHPTLLLVQRLSSNEHGVPLMVQQVHYERYTSFVLTSG
jgi:hypothetical protein